MREGEDFRWLQVAGNELNNLLKVADESVHLLELLCNGGTDAKKYFDFLRTSLERASKVTGQLADRMEGRAPEAPPAALAIPPAAQSGIEIVNPDGDREL